MWPDSDPAFESKTNELLRLIARVPDRYRQFVVDADRAQDDFGMPSDLLSALRSAGLPCVYDKGTWLFDEYDVRNAALHLDPSSRQRKILNWWVRELGRPSGELVCYSMAYAVDCAGPGHDGPCEFRLLMPDGRRVKLFSDGGNSNELARATFRLPRVWPEFPERLAELVDEIRDLRFIWLPSILRDDIDFVAAHRIGPCLSVARLICHTALRRGFRARLSFGRVLTPPISITHFWTEVLIDETWVPVDPLMTSEMLRWGLLDPQRWDCYRSLGGIFGRLAGRWRPLIAHNGRVIEPRLRVSRAGATTR